MNIGLLCGKRTVDLELPGRVKVLDMHYAEPLSDQTGAVVEALSNPIGSPPLKDLSQGKKNACIVISDFTRPVPNKIILPPILKTLEEKGMSSGSQSYSYP